MNGECKDASILTVLRWINRSAQGKESGQVTSYKGDQSSPPSEFSLKLDAGQ